ncbi:hypothetical protein FNJ47_04345 [Bradyrhizobium sp. UFLA 03-164]|uniref:Uncharacterized protein n=1 Tax=Bradyrhizobium uaiense TaxID=2594946 RepID=A0A6P1B9Q1_9BRAD|nr:hypothetical protein [Bradyrhizobium uaiense]
MELIICHDCSGQVSFSAQSCPHCGSEEPAGPYQMSRREKRAFRREAHNDRNLIVGMSACSIAGAVTGWITAGGFFQSMVLPPLYAIIGASVGLGAALLVNVFSARMT